MNNVSQRILTIGPDYHNHRGGIGAVLEVYNKYFEQFKFLASFKVGSSFYKSYFFIGSILKLIPLLIFDRKIQIVHIHGASYGSFFRKFFIFLLAKYIFRKKVIYHIHGGGFAYFYLNSNLIFRKMIKIFIEKSDAIICLSESWKNFYLKNFRPKKIFITPNIIDYPIISKIEEKCEITTYLFLGLICDAKGIFDLIEVIVKNKENYSNKIQLIIGGNGQIDKLNNIIKEHSLEGLVEFVGWISNKVKNSWLQKADIYILPSYKEGLPISILEAMSYGQAIISTNVGGIPEIVIAKKNGILIEPGNLAEIEAAINFFIENPNKIQIYGQESKLIAKKHQPDLVISELLTIYQLLLCDE
jgi:glycosyltransferase involved in cell wall biosynthesis